MSPKSNDKHYESHKREGHEKKEAEGGEITSQGSPKDTGTWKREKTFSSSGLRESCQLTGLRFLASKTMKRTYFLLS